MLNVGIQASGSGKESLGKSNKNGFLFLGKSVCRNKVYRKLT